MRLKMWWVWLVASLLCGISSTSAWAQRMKLLAPGVGWTTSGRSFGRQPRLLWTNNGGADWKDMTPPNSNDAVMHSVFFLDASHGWVVSARGGSGIPGGVQFEIASTNDAGSTWSAGPVTIPSSLSRLDFNGGASVSFADLSSGMLALGTGSTPIAGAGAVLATSDGGKTWKATPSHFEGGLVAVTPQVAWLAADQQLYVTRDDGGTWQECVLRSPLITDQMKELDREADEWRRKFRGALSPEQAKFADKWMSQYRQPAHAVYDLPVFADPRHGYISVSYPGVVVLFATSDGGVTWKPDRTLTGLKTEQAGTRLPSAVADSTWITARASKDSMPQLKALGPGANVTDNTMPAPEESGISEMSFVSAKEGWVRTVYGKLLSTTDGGATWTDITPARAPRAGSLAAPH